MKNRFCFYTFFFIFIASLCSGFIANDKPLIVFHKNQILLPTLKTYWENDLGGTSERPVDFSDEFGTQILKNSFCLYPLIPYGPNTIDYEQAAPHRPNLKHFLGTDDHGRDLFVRLIYGMRVSLSFALLLTFLGTIIGLIIGGIQGYFGGNTDIAVGRFVELWCSLPSLFIILILSSFLEPNFFLLLIIMLMFSWVPLAYLTRTEFLRARTLDYVRAAEVLGVSNFNIIRRHILPNTLITLTSYAPFMVNVAVIHLVSLDFLGFGLPSGTPSLGEILCQAKDNLNAPWIGLSIFFAMSFVLSLLIFIGESLRDYYNIKDKNA